MRYELDSIKSPTFDTLTYQRIQKVLGVEKKLCD